MAWEGVPLSAAPARRVIGAAVMNFCGKVATVVVTDRAVVRSERNLLLMSRSFDAALTLSPTKWSPVLLAPCSVPDSPTLPPHPPPSILVM